MWELFLIYQEKDHRAQGGEQWEVGWITGREEADGENGKDLGGGGIRHANAI